MSNNTITNISEIQKKAKIFIDRFNLPDELIIPYYNLAKELYDYTLLENMIFFISPFDGISSFKDIINCLTDTERQIIILSYGLDGNEVKSFSKIAEILNIPEYNAKRMKSRAIANLRIPSRLEACSVYHLKKLADYYSNAIKHLSDLSSIKPIDKIETLLLSTRTYNCLKRANILTIGALKRLSKNELKSIKNLGPNCANEIWAKLYGESL